MRDCKKIHPLLSAHVDGQLSPVEKGKVDKHLSLCADARAELEQLGGLLKALHQMPEPKVPDDLHAKIMSRLGGSSAPLPIRRGFWGPPAWALSAAAIFIFILLNQYPHWQDTLRVDRTRLDQETTTTPPSAGASTHGQENKVGNYTFTAATNQPAAAPPASQGYFAAQPEGAGGKNMADFKMAPAVALKNLKENDQNAYLGMKKEDEKDVNETLAANAHAPAVEQFGNAAGGADLYIPKPAATLKTSRAKKNRASAPAPSEPASLPIPTPTVESFDKSIKSLTYSREESVTTWKGNNGPATVESEELVTDAATFEKYWNLPHPGETPPAVDFTTQAVVVLMAEGKPTAGYSIYVSRLEEKTDQLVIHYRVESPAADAVTAQILTRPWSLQIIPKPLKPVVFVKDP